MFASDLDNTLLFSYRHRQETDQCVELLEGKSSAPLSSKIPPLVVTAYWGTQSGGQWMRRYWLTDRVVTGTKRVFRFTWASSSRERTVGGRPGRRRVFCGTNQPGNCGIRAEGLFLPAAPE